MIKIRTCIACRNKFVKDNLIKVISKEGIAVIDDKQKLSKRGIYLCKNKECIDKVLNNKKIFKNLKLQIDEVSFKELLISLKEDM